MNRFITPPQAPISRSRAPKYTRLTRALRMAPGLQLGLNLFNGLLIGVLGLPGFGLLLLLQWVL